MGIPSYFRHILKKYPSLIKGANVDNPHNSDILLVDFNCLIYGCLKSKNLPVYTPESEEKWEDCLLEEIKAYVVFIWKVCNSPKTVFLAVDGVVPMAKIRQQRLRRFKGVWLAEKEREAGIRERYTWDSNAITPGTRFMERLTIALKTLCTKRGSGWSVSGAESPGEGEQKVMKWVRDQGASSLKNKHITVYGLDADLILLSLLHSAENPLAKWSILRESQEFGKNASAHEFTTLNIDKLLSIMFPHKTNQITHLLDYITGMTLLGNDFLPHSLGFVIRESGHEKLLNALDCLYKTGATLLNKSKIIIKSSLIYILKILQASEEEDIRTAFYKKYSMPPPTPRNDAERAMLPFNNLPLEWAEEKHMWSSNKMNSNWKDVYYTHETPLSGEQDIYEKCISYFTGLQWVINYYTGKEVSMYWNYPWTHPPLWQDLYRVAKDLSELPAPELQKERALLPQEQLALVLPYESWKLIRNANLKILPTKIPVFWNKLTAFHSLGKRWLWECNPVIPILTPARLYFELERSDLSHIK
jgi:5'-3' exonuclease